MAKKKKNKKKKGYKYPILPLKVKRWIVIVVLLLLALVFIFSFLGRAGRGGKVLFDFFYFLIGGIVFIIPLLLILASLLFWKPQKKRIYAPIFGGIVLMILGGCGLFQIMGPEDNFGGIIGSGLSWPFLTYFGNLVSIIIFSALIVISLLIIWEFTPKKAKEKIKKEKKKEKPKKEKFTFIKKPEFKVKEIEKVKKPAPKEKESEEEKISPEIEGNYKMPPLSLFSDFDDKISSSGNVKEISKIIEKTLANFNILVEMREINIGPTVTQYTFKPEEGVKLSKITTLSNDLALALAAHPIRIEAPIPGRSLVGIEVPNRSRANVSLKEMLKISRNRENKIPLELPLGKDVAGNSVFADLERMPHLLVAGSTGSGKTIFLQDLIVSLVANNSPQILKLILVDPKRVEFPVYNNLPHLLIPIVYKAQKTVNVLNWLIGEMERRFEILRETKSRDIQSHNSVLSKNKKLREEMGIMPYIILVIDELADLMAAKEKEIEAGIVRLSQLARATGIHLIVATQRPSVDVITGLIKANLTSRVSFQVASQTDSRTILDSAGAETLTGRGDMLYQSSEFGKPKRLQACFIPQADVKKVISFINKNNNFEKESEIEEKISEDMEKVEERQLEGSGGDDPLYDKAREVVVRYRKASASLLQRRLSIGYARAARILDMLEENGVVGPPEGSKPREVYVEKEETSDDFDEPDTL